eukprot:3388743-Pyramimonas_sp.AAC.1
MSICSFVLSAKVKSAHASSPRAMNNTPCGWVAADLHATEVEQVGALQVINELLPELTEEA